MYSVKNSGWDNNKYHKEIWLHIYVHINSDFFFGKKRVTGDMYKVKKRIIQEEE